MLITHIPALQMHGHSDDDIEVAKTKWKRDKQTSNQIEVLEVHGGRTPSSCIMLDAFHHNDRLCVDLIK